MGIKLSDYIENPNEALSEEDWNKIYFHALIDSGDLDIKLAEKLMEASNEALKIELENGSIIEGVYPTGDVTRGLGAKTLLFTREED